MKEEIDEKYTEENIKLRKELNDKLPKNYFISFVADIGVCIERKYPWWNPFARRCGLGYGSETWVYYKSHDGGSIKVGEEELYSLLKEFAKEHNFKKITKDFPC
jgi:hypothetical protein